MKPTQKTFGAFVIRPRKNHRTLKFFSLSFFYCFLAFWAVGWTVPEAVHPSSGDYQLQIGANPKTPKCSFGQNEEIDPMTDLVAAFAASCEDQCPLPTAINFTNLSQNATSYYWDFGDNSTSTEENPSHLYSQTGVYLVRLTVCGEGAQQESIIGTVDIVEL